jgi:tungstate transport system permease protein
VTRLFHETLRAVLLIFAGDAEVWFITGVTLQVSLTALCGASLAAVPLAYGLARSSGRAVRLATWLLHTLTALPTVVVGLGLYFILSASGPLGWLDMLYTRTAMVAGQFVLAVPVVGAVALTALRSLRPEATETADSLGLRGLRRMKTVIAEVRPALVSGVMIAFARVFTELGAALILGGNIRGRTRTLTTVIALEHTKGDDARAIALGIILMVIALTVNGVVQGATHWGNGGDR